MYLTNFVKIQPKGNNIKPFFTGKHLTEEGKKWQEILREELNDTSANVIIAAGGTALFALTGRIGIKKWRGSILDCTICPNRKVIPIIHPASVIYGDFIARYFIVADLKRAKEESQFPEFNLPRPNLIIFPTPAEAIEYIRTCQRAKRVVFDIECLGGQVSCFSVSYKPGEAMSISVKDYSVYDEVMVWQALAEIMGDEEVTKIGQNLIFDLFFIFDKNHIFTRGPLRDTMIAHHILYPDFPKGLDFLTSLHTKHPYYKDDGKQWREIKDETTFARYSAMDAITTCDVEHERWPELI